MNLNLPCLLWLLSFGIVLDIVNVRAVDLRRLGEQGVPYRGVTQDIKPHSPEHKELKYQQEKNRALGERERQNAAAQQKWFEERAEQARREMTRKKTFDDQAIKRISKDEILAEEFEFAAPPPQRGVLAETRTLAFWGSACLLGVGAFAAAFFFSNRRLRNASVLPGSPHLGRAPHARSAQPLLPSWIVFTAAISASLNFLTLFDAFWVDPVIFRFCGKMTCFLFSVYLPIRVLLPPNDVIPSVGGGAGLSEKGKRMAGQRQPHESRRMFMSMFLDVSLVIFMLFLAAYYFSATSIVKFAVFLGVAYLPIRHAQKQGWSFVEFKERLKVVGYVLILSPAILPVLERFIGGGEAAPWSNFLRVVLATHALHLSVRVLYLGGETVGPDATRI